MRSQIYDNALASAIVDGNSFRINAIENGKELRKKLSEVATELQNGLNALGFNLLGSPQSPITTISIESTAKSNEESAINELMNVVVDLRETFGIFCIVLTAPFVPKGTLLLRLNATARHTSEDVKSTIEAFAQVSKKLQAGDYARQTVVGLSMK